MGTPFARFTNTVAVTFAVLTAWTLNVWILVFTLVAAGPGIYRCLWQGSTFKAEFGRESMVDAKLQAGWDGAASRQAD